MDSGSLYSNMGPGMLGLEMSLHHQIPQQNTHHHMHQQPPPHPHLPLHHPIVSYAHQENVDNQQQAALRQVFPFKAKNQSLNFSDDDEPVPVVSADNNSTDDGKRNNSSNKTCPWQRMKWTDNMVRLLIMVVYYIGDEVGSEGNNTNDPSGKKKSGGGGGGGGGVGVLQKKGKWKSVSRAMMERGFYVSPQQCEDKFNDLNKRYKRVNDILGKGTSCRVVENQKLLETMDHLSPKMKEEVKKLLNSKHLFFREMCAYHNSCGQNGVVVGGGSGSGSGVANAQAQQQQQQKCLHSSENANARIGASIVEGPKIPKGASGEHEEENENEEEEEDEDEDEEDDDDHDHDHNHHSHDEDDDMDERSRKRQRKLGTSSPMVQQMSMSIELANVVQDRVRSPLEKSQWMKTKMMQLEAQHVSYLCQEFELQKQRLKWKKFISKKEREMERDKLINERKKLENERMMLLLKQKELELVDYHQHHPNNNNRNSDPSSVTG